MKILWIALAAIVLTPGLAAAGDCDDGGDCFRARGCPHCKGSFLLEFMIAGSDEECGEGGWFGGEIGYLWNLGPDYGLGFKFFMAGDDCGQRNGIRLVTRRWINPKLSFEVAPGIALGGAENQAFPAFSLQMALDIEGVLAPVFSLEMIKPGLPSGWSWVPGTEHPTRWETFFGVRTSSYGVPIALLLLIAGVGASGGVM